MWAAKSLSEGDLDGIGTTDFRVYRGFGFRV